MIPDRDRSRFFKELQAVQTKYHKKQQH